MSAIILLKSSSLGNDQTLLIGPRSGVWIPFDFGTPKWSEVRMGMFFSAVSTSSVYISGTTSPEIVAITTEADRFVFGLISGSIATPIDRHGTSETAYFGVASSAGHTASIDKISAINNLSSGIAPIYAIGTTTTVGTDMNASASAFVFNLPENTNELYCGFKGIRLVTVNPTGNMTLNIYAASGKQSGSYTVPELRTLLNNSIYTQYASGITWTPASLPRPLPANFYIWNPYYSVGIKISALEIIKIA